MSGEEYRRAMETLARETTMPPETAAKIEQQLLDAFANCDAATAATSSQAKSVVGRSQSWRSWVATAAAILLVASAGYLWRTGQPRVNVAHQATPARTAEKPPVGPTSVVPRIDQAPSVEVPAAHAPAPNRKPPKTAVVTSSGFVDLPWSAGLPAFESGEIVRMDIPVASLPTYGIDISPGMQRGPVEADVLIGQDGFARAIRLVTMTSRSRQ